MNIKEEYKFKTNLAKTVFLIKYAHMGSWLNLSHELIKITDGYFDSDEQQRLFEYIYRMKFIPAGRYLYYAGRDASYYNNCYLFRAADTREGWARLCYEVGSALMCGGGTGTDYSKLRAAGSLLKRTGGVASGPISLIRIIDNIAKEVQQGGQRRCLHEDTLVTLANNKKVKIKDIVVGNIVKTRFGCKRVTNVYHQGIQPTYKLTTAYGNVVATENHKFLIDNKWTNVKNIKEGMSIHYVQPIDDDTDKISMNKEYAYFIGYVFGHKGNINRNTLNLFVDRDSVRINKRKISTHITDKLFKALYITSPGFTVHTRNKYISTIVCKDKSLIKDLETYMDDYNLNVDKILGWSVESIRALLAGMCDSFNVRYSDCLEIGHINEYTDILIGKDQEKFFRDTIGKYVSPKIKGYLKCEYLTNDIRVKILNKVYNEEAITYDIEVEDVHEFEANGFVSHNSANFASLDAEHADIHDFIKLKQTDGVIPYTNISVNFNSKEAILSDIFWETLASACKYGSPGMSFNLRNPHESLRNACCEVTSEDNNDVCNLGSLNMGAIDSLQEFKDIVYLGEKFLLCGSEKAMLPHKEIEETRKKNNRTGLGLMGVHEWLLKRGYSYNPNSELNDWLILYNVVSESEPIKDFCEKFNIPIPVKFRSIAPTGSTSILAGTTSGIEPIFCPAYLRGFHHKDGKYKHEYVVDPVAKNLYKSGIDINSIECAYNIDPVQRINFQAYVQQFVDHAISSTVNLPKPLECDEITEIGECIQGHSEVLRGITFYPDGAKGGQPFQPVPFQEAIENEGKEKQVTVCELNGSGICGD
jgi:hypothetical protein